MIEIKIFRLRLALKTPFRIAHGTYDYRENVFIQIRKDNLFGYGEAPVVPYYGVTTEAVEADLRNGACLAPLGNLDSIEDLLYNQGPGTKPQFVYPVSFCAFQSALISLQGIIKQQNGARILGIDASGSMPQTSFTLAHEDNIEDMVHRARTCGFRRFKVKAGIPGDIERIARIKELLPEALIRVDANQGWSLEEAPGKIAALERIGVELIEEPIAGTPAEMESLAQAAAVPIVLDESVRNIGHLRSYVTEAPHVAGIVVKIAKTGGPFATLALIEAAGTAGLQVMLSSMVESSVGIGAALSLASLCSWIDLDAPLLLADNPFQGLAYINERPMLQSGGLYPSAELESYLAAVPSIHLEE
ncbi:MAG: hypothetical protein HQ557_13185 [Bacteroidetes bacterium]|nr:hypothetical protein [Bacteroidota bacterium]